MNRGESMQGDDAATDTPGAAVDQHPDRLSEGQLVWGPRSQQTCRCQSAAPCQTGGIVLAAACDPSGRSVHRGQPSGPSRSLAAPVGTPGGAGRERGAGKALHMPPEARRETPVPSQVGREPKLSIKREILTTEGQLPISVTEVEKGLQTSMHDASPDFLGRASSIMAARLISSKRQTPRKLDVVGDAVKNARAEHARTLQVAYACNHLINAPGHASDPKGMPDLQGEGRHRQSPRQSPTLGHTRLLDRPTSTRTERNSRYHPLSPRNTIRFGVG